MASSIRIPGRPAPLSAGDAKGTPRAPRELFAQLLKAAPGAARDEAAQALEKLLPESRRTVEDALLTFDDKERAQLLAASTTGKTPKLAELFKSSVRAVDDAEFRRRVGNREKLIAAHESGIALTQSMQRLDFIADKAVAAFDPLTGDVLVDVDRLAGKNVEGVLAHEGAHRKMAQLSPEQRAAVVNAFTSSPQWPVMRATVEAGDIAVVNMSNARIVDELLATVAGEPGTPLAKLVQPILDSDALAPLRAPASNKPFVGTTGELELDGWIETDTSDPSANWSRLNDTQKDALRDAEKGAEDNSKAKHQALVDRVKRLGFSEADLTKALDYFATKAQVTVNFTPDKQTADGKPLIDAFLAEASYKNQFESKITSGSFGPTEGSMRDGWEKTIFKGDYNKHSLIPAERPKYGSLNAEENAAGGAQYYGNSFLVLKNGVKNRLTMTPYDSSSMQANQVGTSQHIENVLADASVPDGKLTAMLDIALGRPRPAGDWSSNYIEAQLHGPLDFATDVDRVVVNSRYKGNASYEPKLRDFAKKLGVELDWTDGSTIFDDNSVPMQYSFGGMGYLNAPQPPKDFTAVHYADTVAYVPATATPAKPANIPRGYVLVDHPAAGMVIVPERLTAAGKLNPALGFGDTASGQPAPAVALGKSYQVPNTVTGGNSWIDGPAVPAGYTAIALGVGTKSGFAFVPTAKDSAVPATPFGFEAVKNAKAGTILIPQQFLKDGAPAPGLIFGNPLAGLAAPVVSLAPPPNTNYSLPNQYGPAYGTVNVSAPAAPTGYTAVRFGDSVAFVPAKADAPAPDEAPAGYVAYKHAAAGLTFLPVKYMEDGVRSKDVSFGIAASGMAAPAVELAKSYPFSDYPYPIEAPVPPPGYTVVRFNGQMVAYVPTAKETPVPANPPDGYAAVNDPEAGTVFVPNTAASGGALTTPAGTNPYAATAKDMPPPVVAMAPPAPVSVQITTVGYGTFNVQVPPPPTGYTIIGYGNNVAYLPTGASTPVPKKAPNGYVAVTDPEAGTIFIPASWVLDGKANPGIPFGSTAAGYAAPVVNLAPPAPVNVQIPSPYAGGGMQTVQVPPAPDGYTIVAATTGGVAYVPKDAKAAVPKKPPFGYVPAKVDGLGTVFVQNGMASGDAIIPGYGFGATATGYAEPVKKLSVAVAMPNPSGAGYPAVTLYVPPPPDGYTILGYAGSSVAYVPTSASTAVPKDPPLGYVAVKHKTAGTLFVPAAYAPSGELTAGYAFGDTAAGMPAPVVKLSVGTPQNFTFPGGLNISAYPPPPGYTVVLYGGAVAAYVGTTKDATPPDLELPNYTVIKDPTMGNLLIPSNYCPGGTRYAGYFFSATATGQPAPFMDVNGK
jgi:hypothetical protein